MPGEEKIIQSWKKNAGSWISLIGRNGIPSREVATNAAILNAVTALQPQSVLDLGCGEGWLSAALAQQGITVTGTDVVPELINYAAQHIKGIFHVAGYDDISKGRFQFGKHFDTIVSNFALLGKESVDNILPCLPALLQPDGTLLIQTLHPWAYKGLGDYFTGWKQGSWDGLGDGFTEPYEWYFRTLEDWTGLLHQSGFGHVEHTDVRHPQNGNLLSVIFQCREKY